jgi:hypothetical protein
VLCLVVLENVHSVNNAYGIAVATSNNVPANAHEGQSGCATLNIVR